MASVGGKIPFDPNIMIKQNKRGKAMKKKKILWMILAGALALCTACADQPAGAAESPAKEEVQPAAAEEQTEQTLPLSEEPEKEQEPEKEPEKESEEAGDAEKSLFEDMARYDYHFSSGVGGWSTELSIEPDGSFTGSYHDSDMGDTGEGYPNGTLYYCQFSGKFSEPVQTEEYICTTTVEELKYSTEPEQEEIDSDGVRNISAKAYGLEGAKTIYIYKPGIQKDALPEGYLWWLTAPNPSYLDDEKPVGELEAYGIYNEAEDCGFFGIQTKFDREDIMRYYRIALDKQERIDAKYEKEDMDQTTMNMLSYEEFRNWDTLLNNLWACLKESLDPDQMQKLTEEQREWIRQKEAAVSDAGAEYEGGSIRPMIENRKGAELTRKRAEELLRLLQ